MLKPLHGHDDRLDIASIKRGHSVTDVARAAGLKLIPSGGEFKARCPFHSEKSPSFSIFDRGRRWYCFGCGEQGDVLDFVRRIRGVGLREAANFVTGGNLPSVHVLPSVPIEDAERIADAKAIWRTAEPATGTLAETYLRSRAIHVAIPESIRFARLPYGKGSKIYPCLVAAIASADNKLVGVQRTYLNEAGTGKAAVARPKLNLGRVAGGAIRLAPCARSIIVCEGLEDGLTLQQELGRAVWVAGGASMLPKMVFPPGVQDVAIGGDSDDVGRASAQKAGVAFADRGIKARMFFPIDAKDFNQELMEGAAG